MIRAIFCSVIFVVQVYAFIQNFQFSSRNLFDLDKSKTQT
jgi:hypothetical protein